ncbi:MAG: aminoacyl-tRNA hydrolase [Chloroflexi bacterium]|nr:aminoacyl-tRNA hydrolase [Chloroflexota bacterium]
MKLFSRFKKETNSDPRNVFLLVGLGNPGPEYKNNRHNIGFMVLDEIAARLGENFTRVQSQALVTKARHKDIQVVLAKPRTFMNLSGQAAVELHRFYKIPIENLLVICDEVDFPLGVIRLRLEGSSAGHKGMRSIIDGLGTQTFPRLRVGIGRPQGKKSTQKHVLQNFSKAEQKELPFVISRAASAALDVIAHGIEHAMNTYNQTPK